MQGVRLSILSSILCVFMFSGFTSLAQETPKPRVLVRHIELQGNKHTKRAYILLETPFEERNRINVDDINRNIELTKQNLTRTSLFDSVAVNIAYWEGDTLDIRIVVKERWYLYPAPVFDIVDRNFNEWWNVYDHSMKRTVVGVKIYHLNLLGFGDKLETNILVGYNNKLELKYEIPVFDKENNGIETEFSYITNKEIIINTHENKVQLLRNENILRRRYRATLALSRRMHFTQTHSVGIQAFYNKIADSVSIVNRNYFIDSFSHKQWYPIAFYRYVYNTTNSKYYPTQGWLAKGELQLIGLRMTDDYNALRLYTQVSKFSSLSKKINLINTLKGQMTMSAQVPYFNNRGLGYEEDFVRGYEYYVIDGEHFGLSKNAITFNVLDKQLRLGKYAMFPQFKHIPLKVYFKLFGDAAYVHSSQNIATNNFKNRLLYGYGAGFDFVTYYDISARVEYSINHLNKGGVYVHFKLVF